MLFWEPNQIHDFFRNKEMNYFYISIAIINFGLFLISVFVPIYLYKIGYSIAYVIFFFFLLALNFVVFAYPGAKIVSRIGAKHSIFFSVFFVIVYYWGLNFIDEHPLLFFILPTLLSWMHILYNFGYHLNFITNSKKKIRGREISLIGIIGVLAAAIAPFAGGIIASRSFALLYLIGSLALIVGTFPLLLTKDKHKKFRFTQEGFIRKIFSKKERGNALSFAGYAVESYIGGIIWPIFLILVLVTLTKTGFIIMASTFLSIIVLYFMGMVTDRFDNMKLIKFATILYFFGWLGRIFADSTLKIFLVDSYKNISQNILHLPWEAHSYNLATKHGYFGFIVEREVLFNLTRVVVMPLVIAIFLIDWHPFTLSFIIASIASLGYAFINKK